MGILDSVKRWRASFGTTDLSPRLPATPSPPTAREVPDVEYAEGLAEAYQGPERRGKVRINVRTGIKILIIDDSPTIVTVLRKMMQQNDYRTLEAYSAEEALELVQRERPDLIFLDIVLPGMDGFAALRALRRDPNTKSIPIIMISGNTQATEQFYVQRIGADDFIKKPFSRAEVFARIERLLDAEGVPQRISAIQAIALRTTSQQPAPDIRDPASAPDAQPKDQPQTIP